MTTDDIDHLRGSAVERHSFDAHFADAMARAKDNTISRADHGSVRPGGIETRPASTTRLTFHALSCALLTYPFYYIQTHPNHINTAYGWHFQYLTILTLTLTYIQFILASLLDLLRASNTSALVAILRASKRAILLIAGPVECLISVIYWPIKSYDATLLAPPEIVATFPLSADLSMHAIPTILLLVEIFGMSEALEASTLVGMVTYSLYGLGYYAWIKHCQSINGWYPYPMFDLMTEAQRRMTVAGATIIAFGSFLGLRWAYRLVYGTPPPNKALHKR